jgi:hypothetical protein
VYERQVELSVGQTLQIGDVLMTIVEIEGDEIHVRLDNGDDDDWAAEERREVVLALPR